MILILYFRNKLLKKSSESIQLFRLSSNTFEKSSTNGNGIVIPKRINRSSTDILKVNIYTFTNLLLKLIYMLTFILILKIQTIFMKLKKKIV